MNRREFIASTGAIVFLPAVRAREIAPPCRTLRGCRIHVIEKGPTVYGIANQRQPDGRAKLNGRRMGLHDALRRIRPRDDLVTDTPIIVGNLAITDFSYNSIIYAKAEKDE